jgi:hypothetical protein
MAEVKKEREVISVGCGIIDEAASKNLIGHRFCMYSYNDGSHLLVIDSPLWDEADKLVKEYLEEKKKDNA